MKKNILCFVLGIIVASSVAYAVTTISADQINYDENTTVKDKIDDLYTISQVIPNVTYISGNYVVEDQLASYTYTATEKGKVVITMHSFRGNSGSVSNYYCKKNNANVTPLNSYDINENYRASVYIINVEKNDVITVGAKCTGSYGDSSYTMFFIK